MMPIEMLVRTTTLTITIITWNYHPQQHQGDNEKKPRGCQRKRGET
jgi:hypothetical protein